MKSNIAERASRREVVAIALSIACSVFCMAAHAGKPEGTLHVAFDQALESIDPYFNNVRVGVIIAANVWDTLLYRDPATQQYKGLLAKSWKRINDRTLEFELREGVKFHNGEEFDADSVVYTLNFIANPGNKVVTQTNVNWIERAEKLGKHKVRLISKKVFPAALEYLAGPIVFHPAKYYADADARSPGANPVGTGPYKVVQSVPGKSITLERNDDYFEGSPKGRPQIARIEIRFIPDRQAQIAEVLAGNLNLITNVPRDQAEHVVELPQLQLVSSETMRIAFMQFNELDGSPAKQLKDVRVRKALSYAIDREGIARHLVGAGSRVIHSICFPSQFGCTDEGVPRYAYDPGKARRLLAEAGYPNGFEIEIMAYRDRAQAEAIISNLAAVGVKARLSFAQYAAMRDAVRANKASLTHYTWGSFSINDVSASTPAFFGFEGDDLARDPEVRNLLDKGNNSVDPQTRKEAYKSALSLIAGRAHALPLWSLPAYYVASKDLAFRTYPDEVLRFWEMNWK